MDKRIIVIIVFLNYIRKKEAWQGRESRCRGRSNLLMWFGTEVPDFWLIITYLGRYLRYIHLM